MLFHFNCKSKRSNSDKRKHCNDLQCFFCMKDLFCLPFIAFNFMLKGIKGEN